MSGDAPPDDVAADVPREPERTAARRGRDIATAPLANIAGVRLRPGGRSFTCDAGKLSLRVGTRVVVQADRGAEVGIVTVSPALRPVLGRVQRILRIADARDLEREVSENARVAEILDLARAAVRDRHLAVKVFHAEIQSGGRTTLYFASEARIDFRDLVRGLSERLRLRIEMRQVGVRDEAKMVGGLGSCGRELCCSTFLQRFAPISIKAAKNQNIALTPSKVTGQCGRLKCCLVYEEANYIEAAKSLPRLGKRVETPDGIGRVGDLDVLRGRVRVLFQDGPPKVYEGGEVRAAPAPDGGAGGASGAGSGAAPARANAAPPHPEKGPAAGRQDRGHREKTQDRGGGSNRGGSGGGGGDAGGSAGGGGGGGGGGGDTGGGDNNGPG